MGFGEWPHMCAILEETLVDGAGETQKQFQCGASLIDTGIVLTAAHCLAKFRNDVSKLIVRCGEWDTQHTTEPYPHQDVGVESIEIHPEFNPRNLANDFAVMFLKENVVLDFNIDTVCLPEPGQNFDGSTCFATGWGKDEFGADGRFQVVLKEIEIPTVDSNTCQAKLRSTRLGQRFRLDPSFMCAGGVPGKDTCKGDGGGYRGLGHWMWRRYAGSVRGGQQGRLLDRPRDLVSQQRRSVFSLWLHHQPVRILVGGY